MAIGLAPAVPLFMLDSMKRIVAAQPPIHWNRSDQLSSKRDLLNQGRTEPFFDVLLRRWGCTGPLSPPEPQIIFKLIMGFRFSRRVSILPGLRLNLSGSGVSLSAGVRGAQTHLGPRGLYGSARIPGTGLCYR